jgi:glycosyltransferase involved in cell wall biosynthesis
MKTVAIVVPFLNELENLKGYAARVAEVRALLKEYRVDFYFVDDGSTDGSFEYLVANPIPGTYVLRLSRNFGSHYAIFAAIDRCDADFLTFMSADMQEKPDLVVRMLAELENADAQLALAVRRNRSAPLFDRLTSRGYNWFARSFVFKDSPRLGADVFLINRQIIELLRSIPEKNTSIYGILYLIGFRRVFVDYEQTPRTKGKSRWTLAKKLKLMSDTVVSFTILPLRLITITGVIFSVLGFAFGALEIVLYLQGKITLVGFATVITILTFGFGLVFLMIGVISEYMWRMFDQIRPRPRYIVQDERRFPLAVGAQIHSSPSTGSSPE